MAQRLRFSRDADILAAAVKAAVKDGWVVKNGGKHPKLVSPTGQAISFSYSPSRGTTAKNIVSRLRRAGVAC